jgi:hypothetical protein
VRRWLRGLLGSFACGVLMVSPAAAQTPLAPANGERVTASEVVVRWSLDDGSQTNCVEWSHRPETSFPGGPFLRPADEDCDLNREDVAYLLDELDVAPYYWHVQVDREVCSPPDESGDRDCRTETVWGPTAYFDSIAPPPPTGCTPRAAEYFAEEVLLPEARQRYPGYYRETEDADWTPRPVICRDLTGDRDREMIVRLTCCTGGSLSPWAIFKHNKAGQWRMAYVQVRDTVFRLRVEGRVVRTELPAPYEGGCTRYVRWREVRWSQQRFRSRTTDREPVRHLPRGCR